MSMAVAIRATPPKHSPAASSSALQVELKRLIGAIRLDGRQLDGTRGSSKAGL
jgi:hypothetical protein